MFRRFAPFLFLPLAACASASYAGLVEPGPAASVRPCALLPGGATVVAGRSVEVPQLAAAYQPRVLQEIRRPSPPLIRVGYEVIGEADVVHLLYYMVWENEVHPNPVIHRLYEGYRRMRTGSPLDIEYIQVSVDRGSGAIRAVRLETSAAGEFCASVVRHSLLTLHLDSMGTYTARTRVAGGRPRVRERVPLHREGSRPAFAIQTWNHMWRTVEEQEPGLRPMEAPLHPVSLPEYRRLHLARRSQGDYMGEQCRLDPRRIEPVRGVEAR